MGAVIQPALGEDVEGIMKLPLTHTSRLSQGLVHRVFDGRRVELGPSRSQRVVIEVNEPLRHTISIYGP